MKILTTVVLACVVAGSLGQTVPATKPAGSQTAPTTRPDAVLLCYRATKDVELTADPESDLWKGIAGVTIDKSVMGPVLPGFKAEVKTRWTADFLYVLFIGHYEKLTLYENPKLDAETPRLWERDVFELYIGADFEHTNRYREIQVSPQGEWLDNDIDSTVRRPGFNGEDAWNSGVKVKAKIDEKNKIWYGEMKIPLKAIDTRPAKVGNEMRVNLYRQDGSGPGGPTARGPNVRTFMAWQTPGVWNPHHPEIFGTLRMVEAK